MAVPWGAVLQPRTAEQGRGKLQPTGPGGIKAASERPVPPTPHTRNLEPSPHRPPRRTESLQGGHREGTLQRETFPSVLRATRGAGRRHKVEKQAQPCRCAQHRSAPPAPPLLEPHFVLLEAWRCLSFHLHSPQIQPSESPSCLPLRLPAPTELYIQLCNCKV